jgi:uncharacterized damage-inducible protein DinB
MVDQIYYKVQYPLKKAIDLMKNQAEKDIEDISADLSENDKEKISAFIDNWKTEGKSRLYDLVNDLRSKK